MTLPLLCFIYNGWTIRVAPKGFSIGVKSKKPYFACQDYCFSGGKTSLHIPAQVEGHVRCLFKTRREARDAVRGLYGKYYKYSVVRAQVIMREL